jgi:hypothetical protein
MEAATSPSAMTEQDLKTGLSRLGEGSRPAPASVRVLGFAVALDELGQVVVARVLQESPAAYSGQVGVGDVVEAVDGRMVTSVQQLAVAADGLVRSEPVSPPPPPPPPCAPPPRTARADVRHVRAHTTAGGHAGGAGAAAERRLPPGVAAPDAAAPARLVRSGIQRRRAGGAGGAGEAPHAPARPLPPRVPACTRAPGPLICSVSRAGGA